ncbi:uncharacterized protein LOC121693270 [Alosa sapidissima]|uniref:uncharacterized protein LOC121693270 n=1 Tax=Alosa sapidissima TaxID=34773 RepID=UPI001C08BD0D|nr:uncharacterized protein LOC121693270 [Alosa sapidissima]
MAETTADSPETLVNTLTKFILTGRSLLQIAQGEVVTGSLQDFIRNKISIERPKSLLGLIAAGAELYKGLSVKKKKEAEDLWGSKFRHAEVREVVEDLLQLGADWDAFLEGLDNELQPRNDALSQTVAVTSLAAETVFTDGRTGTDVSLRKYLGKGSKTLLVLIRQFSCLLCRLHFKELQARQEDLDLRSIRVVVVSFGCQEGALDWLKETGCPYDMLLDPQRNVYTAFGFGVSLLQVLRFNNMLQYSEFILSNLEFPRPLPTIQDDMFQLGGDVLLDDCGRVLFSHSCTSPLDRPGVDDILSAIS